MAKKYNIAIDASPLYDGNSIRGVGHYTKCLVEYLDKQTQTKEFSNYNIELITNQNQLSRKNYQVIHYPYFDPFFLTLPPKTGSKRIVTVHDLIPRQFKSHFPVGLKGEIKWLIQKHRLMQSNYIITPSHDAKYNIHQLTSFPVNRIVVTHEAATPDFKPLSGLSLTHTKQKYQLPEKFVMYLGDINWNKNIPLLVNACLELNYPLVLVGSSAIKTVPIHPWTKDLLWVQAIAEKHPDKIIRTGFVPDEDLPKIFNLATLYCQPSIAEGFGLSLVQAMQSGTPVVYSSQSCLNEIMDYSGLMFDPFSIDSLKKSLSILWNDKILRSKYSKQGLVRVKSFSWENTASQTLDVYEMALKDEK